MKSWIFFIEFKINWKIKYSSCLKCSWNHNLFFNLCFHQWITYFVFEFHLKLYFRFHHRKIIRFNERMREKLFAKIIIWTITVTINRFIDDMLGKLPINEKLYSSLFDHFRCSTTPVLLFCFFIDTQKKFVLFTELRLNHPPRWSIPDHWRCKTDASTQGEDWTDWWFWGCTDELMEYVSIANTIIDVSARRGEWDARIQILPQKIYGEQKSSKLSDNDTMSTFYHFLFKIIQIEWKLKSHLDWWITPLLGQCFQRTQFRKYCSKNLYWFIVVFHFSLQPLRNSHK